MTNYVKTTNFLAKDSLAPGDPNKKVKGSEIDTEYNNIQTASASKANKVVGGTSGDIAVLDASGDLTAGGVAINLAQVQADFAALAGLSTQTFDVANATAASEAVPLGQLPGKTAVASYAAVRALDSTIVTYTMVQGRTTVADGGQGWFGVDASDTTSLDNGGTILVATDGARWKRVFSGAVNVLWFGMPTDGSDIVPTWLIVRDFCAKKYDIYFPAGHYTAVTDLYVNGLGNQEIFGDGAATVIENIDATGSQGNVFTGVGIARNWLPDYVKYALSDIAASDSMLTFTVAADALNIVAGLLYYLGSNDDIAGTPLLPLPTFSILVKVLSVDTVAGTVTLDSPIGTAVVNPIISNTNTTVNPNNQASLMDELSIHSLKGVCPHTATVIGQLLSLGGSYKCNYHNLWVDSTAAFYINGFVKSHIYDIHATLSNWGFTSNIIEIEIGSQDSFVDNFIIDITNMNANTAELQLIRVGEQARNIHVRDVECNAAGNVLHSLVTLSGTSGCSAKWVGAVCDSVAYSIVYWASSLSGALSMNATKGIRATTKNGYVNAVNLGSGAKDSVIEDVSGVGAVTGSLINLGATLENITLEKIRGDGLILLNPSSSPVIKNVRLLSCETTGVSSSSSANIDLISGSGNTRRSHLTPPRVVLRYSYATGIVANTAVLSYVIKGSDVYTQRDRILIKAKGSVIGTLGAKTVAVSIFGSLYTLVSAAAADTGAAFYIEIDMEINGGTWAAPTAAEGMIRTTYKGVLTESRIGVAADFTLDQTIEVQAWVAVAGDNVRLAAEVGTKFVENTME